MYWTSIQALIVLLFSRLQPLHSTMKKSLKIPNTKTGFSSTTHSNDLRALHNGDLGCIKAESCLSWCFSLSTICLFFYFFLVVRTLSTISSMFCLYSLQKQQTSVSVLVLTEKVLAMWAKMTLQLEKLFSSQKIYHPRGFCCV